MQKFISIALFLVGTVFAAAQTNLITNGDFSAPGIAGTTGAVNSTAPTGWTWIVGSATGTNNYHAKYGQTADNWIPWAPSGAGTYSVQIDSASSTAMGTPGSISQVVASLLAGTTYHLTFSIAAEANMASGALDPLTTVMDVIVTGQTSGNTYYSSVSGSHFTNTQAGYNVSQSAVVWSTNTLTFTPTVNESVKITFQDNAASITNNFSLANVSLITPEVSHWSVFVIFGLVCGAGEWRRRRAQPLAGSCMTPSDAFDASRIEK